MRAVIFIFVLGLLTSCKKDMPISHSTQVYLRLDTSEDSLQTYNLVLRDSAKIVSLIANDSNIYDYGVVNIGIINDLAENATETVVLSKPNHGFLPENTTITQNNIANFRKELTATTKKVLKSSYWKTNQTQLYSNLCKTTQQIQNASSYEKNILIVYTDLLENSVVLNFYRKIDVYTPKLEEQLVQSTEYALPEDLSNMEIRFISKRNPQNDALISKARIFWKALLESHKAKVRFDAEL